MEYRGLTTEEVQQRITEGKVNGKEKRISRSTKEIVLSNTLTYFNLVNLVLFIMVCFTGKIANGTFFLTIVTNACIGIFQEMRSKKLLDKMSIMVETKIPALRNGEWTDTLVSEIVLDDRVQLSSGYQIPADSILLTGYLEVNESMLTGESSVVEKKAGDLLYGGTIITAGEGEAGITAVGEDCFSASILKDAKKYKPAKSQLNEDLNRLLKFISIAIIPVGIILFLMQYRVLNMTRNDAILKTVAAIVGMIPEGLVVLTSIALAVSTVRLLRRKVLVQDLYSIESLARVDTICLDKTGTLTKGSLVVSDAAALLDYEPDYIRDVMGSYLSSEDRSNATDSALKEYFPMNRYYERTEVLPFSSDRKYAGAALDGEGTFYLGAVNFLFPEGCPAANKYIHEFTEKGQRCVVFAHSHEPHISKEGLPDDLEPCALIALSDVLRDNVQNIMAYFKRQGVNCKVISGDDAATVSSLAVQAGIPNARKYVDMSLAGGDLDALAEKYTVFGRVRPEQKKALVLAMQKAGHTVAMTGDGVNDVPALKAADVSVAMSEGSAAAKDSANLVLLTNDFGLMPDIVTEGRRVINNISRASSMYLVKTVFSMLLSLYVVVLQQEYPFLPVHLSIISAFGVGIPTFFLQMEPSFERVKGRFFARAFRNAVPSSITVLLTALVCLGLKSLLDLPVERYYGILVSLTAFIYLYTLYRVYYPLTKLRTGVMIAMAVCVLLVMIFGGEYLQISFKWIDFLVIIPGILVLPVIIAAIARAYDFVLRPFKKRKKA